MPIYEYHCDKCDNTFEDWARHVDDQSEKPCPNCGEQAERIISNTSFVLKGGGWYVTDYGYRKGKTEDNKPVHSSAASGSSSASSEATSSSAAAPASASASTSSSATTSSSASAASTSAAPKSSSTATS